MEACVVHASNGSPIRVDKQDLASVEGYRWYIVGGYAVRMVHVRGTRHWLSMHRQLMGLSYGDGGFVDHANTNPLDNRRRNLRLATNQENCWNHTHKLGASGVRGVYACGSKWQAKIMHAGKVRHLGLFDTREDAGEFRELVADMTRGEFAEHRRTL